MLYCGVDFFSQRCAMQMRFLHLDETRVQFGHNDAVMLKVTNPLIRQRGGPNVWSHFWEESSHSSLIMSLSFSCDRFLYLAIYLAILYFIFRDYLATSLTDQQVPQSKQQNMLFVHTLENNTKHFLIWRLDRQEDTVVKSAISDFTIKMLIDQLFPKTIIYETSENHKITASNSLFCFCNQQFNHLISCNHKMFNY